MVVGPWVSAPSSRLFRPRLFRPLARCTGPHMTFLADKHGCVELTPPRGRGGGGEFDLLAAGTHANPVLEQETIHRIKQRFCCSFQYTALALPGPARLHTGQMTHNVCHLRVGHSGRRRGGRGGPLGAAKRPRPNREKNEKTSVTHN